jgi:hypothetical protein
MNLAVAVLAAAAVGWGAKTLWDKQARPDALSRARAVKLNSGVTYTIQLTVSKAETTDQTTMSNVIKATFEQFGFEVKSTPVPQNATEASNFLAGRASTWIFQGTWRRHEVSEIPSGPSWLGMVVAYAIPIVPDTRSY